MVAERVSCTMTPCVLRRVEAGEKSSFEFSEWTVTTVSNCIRLVIIYRPPYSDKCKIPTTVFFREFSDHLESVLLSKEQILFAGDLRYLATIATLIIRVTLML